MKEVSFYAFIEDKSQAENSPILKTSSSDIFKGKLPVASVPKDDYRYFFRIIISFRPQMMFIVAMLS